MDHKIIRFVEHIMSADSRGRLQLDDVYTTVISTRKIHDFASKHSLEYSRVARLISAALGVRSITSTTREFSFSANPIIFSALIPDKNCADPVVEFKYDVL